MSASEKLKALDAELVQAGEEHWPLGESHTLGLAGGNMVAVSSLRLALPQIVAVVEAAEHYRLAVEPLTTEGPLGRALDALDEALS